MSEVKTIEQFAKELKTQTWIVAAIQNVVGCEGYECSKDDYKELVEKIKNIQVGGQKKAKGA